MSAAVRRSYGGDLGHRWRENQPPSGCNSSVGSSNSSGLTIPCCSLSSFAAAVVAAVIETSCIIVRLSPMKLLLSRNWTAAVGIEAVEALETTRRDHRFVAAVVLDHRGSSSIESLLSVRWVRCRLWRLRRCLLVDVVVVVVDGVCCSPIVCLLCSTTCSVMTTICCRVWRRLLV